MAKNAKQLQALEDAKGEARDAFSGFCKSNKLDMKVKPEDKKLGKQWQSLKDSFEAAKAALAAAGTKVEKTSKEKKPKVERASKYDYPADCVTADQKKKFRANARAEAKRAEKGEGKKGSKKDAGKSSKKADKKAEGKTSGKKAKKAKKGEDDED